MQEIKSELAADSFDHITTCGGNPVCIEVKNISPAVDDPIVNCMNQHESRLFEALYLYHNSLPSIVRMPNYRMRIPDFINESIHMLIGEDAPEIKELEGVSYDWLWRDKKISVKATSEELFPRPYKRGLGTKKGGTIQLKNTVNSLSLKPGEFDYLMVIGTHPERFGYYLYTFDQVSEHLKCSHLYNANCDVNGYDGKGQIKMYPRDRKDCLGYIEIGDQLRAQLEVKYEAAKKISDAARVVKWQKDSRYSVRSQLELTLLSLNDHQFAEGYA